MENETGNEGEQQAIVDVTAPPSPYDEMADELDELLQQVAEMTTSGKGRKGTRERAGNAEERHEILMRETRASISMLKTKNARGAARRRKYAKRRGIGL